ncbi:MAG: entB [Labilithrix sp.]|nr:entB [Labilithrix sp.]
MNATKPTKKGVCLLLIDVINALEFPGSQGLARAAARVAPKIEALAHRAREAGVPVVYVNDNFGQWRSDFNTTVRECAKPEHPGSAVSERLRPHQGDYFVLKAQHSGFYSTPLDLLLDHLGTHTLVMTGFAANLCVAFTANDAHMRGFNLVVPRDCTASNTAKLTQAALLHVGQALHADTSASAALRFERLARNKRKARGQTF